MWIFITILCQCYCLYIWFDSLLLQLCPHILHYGLVDSTTNSLKFCVSRPCRQGEQCYLSYGCFSSSHLINFYGFLPKGDNPYDIIPLGMHFTLLSLALNDQFFILLLQKEGAFGDCSVYNLLGLMVWMAIDFTCALNLRGCPFYPNILMRCGYTPWEPWHPSGAKGVAQCM